MFRNHRAQGGATYLPPLPPGWIVTRWALSVKPPCRGAAKFFDHLKNKPKTEIVDSGIGVLPRFVAAESR